MSESQTNVSSDDLFEETETCQNGSEDISHALFKKIIDPNHPMMTRFQNALKQLLIKQKDDLRQHLFILESDIILKKNDKASMEKEKNSITDRSRTQHDMLVKFRTTKTDVLETIRKKVGSSISDWKQRYREIITNKSTEMEKITNLKRKLAYSQSLLKDLTTYEEEQAIKCKQFDTQKSNAKQLKKIYLNIQQQKNLLCSSLTHEIERLEDHRRRLMEEAELMRNESELLKQRVMDSSTDLDTMIRDNSKLTLLWDTVLTSIKQRSENIQRMKIDHQEAKDKHHTLLVEVNSYERSVEKESYNNKNLRNSSKELKLNQSNLQISYDTLLDKLNSSKDEYSMLIQAIESDQLNLDQVLLDQKTVNNEIQILQKSLNEKSNLKFKYEEDVLSELKKQLLTNNKSTQIDNRISELKFLNKDHELTLLGFEKIFRQATLQLEQYRATSSTLQNDTEKIKKCLSDQELILSTLDSELKKLDSDIHNEMNSIYLKKNILKTRKEKEEMCIVEINVVQYKIDEAQNKTELIKQCWVKNQNKNVELINKRDKQYNELKTIHKIALELDSKNISLNSEIFSLSKEVDQHERALDNTRRNLLKSNETFYKNEGKSSQLLNENEWIHQSYIAELKENEKQCLEHVHKLKLMKNEINEMKNLYAEKKRESLSWETKVQSLVKIKNDMKFKDGDLGDIEAKKKEIHKMQIREKQLQKETKKIMKDLERSLSTHSIIYNKAASKVVSLKGKKDSKQSFLKKLDNLRTVIKKKEIECKKSDKCINSLQHDKIELECKLTSISDKITDIKKDINDLTATIEELGVTKIKNVYELCNKQSYAKFLEEVYDDKYHLVIKSESKISDELVVELKINSDLISVVEALKNDFPNLNVQITRMLCILKSTVRL